MLRTALWIPLALMLGPGPQAPDERPAAGSADEFKAPAAWKRLGPGVWFDPAGHRLAMRARVVLREGALEHLLCLKNTKEHEAILATIAPPKLIHAGLLLTGAEVGHPVRYKPRFEAPAGSPVTIDLEWEADGKTRKANARDWVKDDRTGKPLATDWVFAGSELYTDPITKQTRYAADDGDLITVANFPSAILDLPFASTSDDTDRTFVANTQAVPPVGTWVTMYLHPASPARTARPKP